MYRVERTAGDEDEVVEDDTLLALIVEDVVRDVVSVALDWVVGDVRKEVEDDVGVETLEVVDVDRTVELLVDECCVLLVAYDAEVVVFDAMYS